MLPEYSRAEIRPGIRCEECGVTYTDASSLDHVQLADAELLFCPQCSMAIAVIVDGKEKREIA